MNKKINNLELVFQPLQKSEIDTIINLEKEQNISILSKNIILNEINSQTSKYYIAKYNDIIVGYINISILIDNIDINAIVVKKEFQKMGIATFMLENIFKICKEKNISNILLEVRKSNIIAQNLYIKNGFKKIYTRQQYYPDNLEDAYIYKLSI